MHDTRTTSSNRVLKLIIHIQERVNAIFFASRTASSPTTDDDVGGSAPPDAIAD